MATPVTTKDRATAGSGRDAGFNLTRIREQFPILQTRIREHHLAYLDNGASSQKPRVVVETEASFALHEYANVHRGVHALSQQATAAYDRAREEVAAFIGAESATEVIFTSGTTASLNLVAQSYARTRIRPGDQILVSEMEHHSNIVPWQLAAESCGAVVRAIPVTDLGELDLDRLRQLLLQPTGIVAIAHASNVLGTINPIAEIAALAHAAGAVVVVDGAQAVPHLAVDMRQLGCDFYAASGHKMFGPTGIGFLYGRQQLLDAMPPWQGGGGMIQNVSFERTTFAPVPARFEAGTPPITQAVGLAAAVRWLNGFEWVAIEKHEQDLLAYATGRVSEIPGISVIGRARHKVPVLSLTLAGIHPHDVGTVLDLQGVAVRASHHCAQPLMRRFGIPGTVRASFALYNTRQEVDALIAGLEEARRVFGG